MAAEKRTKRTRGEEATGLSGLIGGHLNIFGVQIDLDDFLGSPGQIQEQLSQLRERLKEAGGKEKLSDVEWREGAASVSGYIRTRGILGDQEFHIGTLGKPGARPQAPGKRVRPEAVRKPTSESAEEPPLDVFNEDDKIRILADVPGASLEDLELKIEDRLFSLATRPGARRAYRHRVTLAAEVDAARKQVTCRNGVLEVILPKVKPGV